MKTAALRKLRRKLADDETTYGLWVTLEAPSITEMAVALGLDWVVIDAEHGHLDWKEIVEHLRATVRSDTVALVGLTERHTCLTKRALDLGADGVVLPWINTAAQLEEALRDCRYPPAGRRGIGGERATVWGQCFQEHVAEANDHVLVVPKIESVEAIEQVPAMCGVAGVELFMMGPADFSATAGHAGHWEGPGVAEQILNIKDTVRATGKQVGLIATGLDNLYERQVQGFRAIAVGTDVGLLARGLHTSLAVVQRDRKPATSLAPADGQPVRPILLQVPAELRPDRGEVMVPVGRGETVVLQEGVSCEMLIGAASHTRGLSTGIVTVQSEAALDLHTHPCTESITVLEGELDVWVEGRGYRLGALDNITIPRWLPHAARNPNPGASTQAHIALAMSRPERTPVSSSFAKSMMPRHSTGRPGAERVTRFSSAERSFIGSGLELIDFFHEDLIPGIEMSGGYLRFQPGARLPAHIHKFDESICIIEGEATCRVETRAYTLADCATAMVPRGRVHYFVNESDRAMAMIWVYAGPTPERLVVDERLMSEKE
jgi:2-dehydro-3-deoxyglucarate aldolase/4-hydroxy-2-oxoheptanedioate aldolase